MKRKQKDKKKKKTDPIIDDEDDEDDDNDMRALCNRWRAYTQKSNGGARPITF